MRRFAATVGGGSGFALRKRPSICLAYTHPRLLPVACAPKSIRYGQTRSGVRSAIVNPPTPMTAPDVQGQRLLKMNVQLESKELRTQHSQALRAKAPIRAHFEDCVQAFDRLCSAINGNVTASEEEVIMVEDCYSRVRLWGQDSGASTRALDHGLRKSSELRKECI